MKMIFTKKLTDIQIKEGILNCDLQVYKYLDKKFRPKTTAYVNVNSGSATEADELYNEVIWRIYQNIEQGKYEAEQGKFAAYFTRIMQNKWNDKLRYRKRKRQIETTELTPIVENHTIHKEVDIMEEDTDVLTKEKCLHKHIEELKDQDQLLIKLFYFNNLKQVEIAEKIGKTTEYIKQRMFKIRKQLKAELHTDPDFIN